MSLRQGAAMSFSRGQKLNVRSSIECKLVRIDDAIPQMMWGKHFIEAQGWTVEHNILYQDNKSIILLVTNGRSSSSKRTKDINHRYFFIKEKVVCGNLEIRHALTEEMWSDVLTKPQQGMMFKRTRAELMNVDVNYDDKIEHKNTHLKLLPQDIETISTKSVELLAKSGVTGPYHKKRNGNPTVVSVTKQLLPRSNRNFTAGVC
jgi:hypothetical protein